MTTEPNYTMSVKVIFVPVLFEVVVLRGSESVTSFLTSALVGS
jgi:hypothetical protein